MKTSNPNRSSHASDDWRCICCDKLLGAIEAGRLHIRFARGHQYIVGIPATVICRGCGTLNELTPAKEVKAA
ncbi:hypothetical protein ACFL6C_07755 [Myxococcota bacterium]